MLTMHLAWRNVFLEEVVYGKGEVASDDGEEGYAVHRMQEQSNLTMIIDKWK